MVYSGGYPHKNFKLQNDKIIKFAKKFANIL